MATQVEQRIAQALVRLVNQSGRKTDEGIEIDFPIAPQDIAKMTGTTLLAVSTLLSAWEREGIVRSSRRKMLVTNLYALVLITANRRQ